MKLNAFCKIVIFILLGLCLTVKAQNVTSELKTEAQSEMQSGRYSEAIDLLNKYISAQPQVADGYNLIALCYEKQQRFEDAVYYFRLATKLEPHNSNLRINLNRATNSWYKLLYNEIEGYKREVAINLKDPNNYLAIGKAYKNLGKWLVAEEWYDKFLTLEHASPDEIIRYSDILGKNNHISKGWPILKKYTEEYPNDQRIWTKFGYFSLWLGKYRTAVKAFENALALKPYFKEAINGLDLAKGNGYIYTINDTSYKNYNYGLSLGRSSFVYPIDRYYRILKNNPLNNKIRFKLIKELYKTNRFEEANQQIQLLENTKYDSIQVAHISQLVDSLQTIYYNTQVVKYKEILAKDSLNKNAVLKLGQAYNKLQEYDSAMYVYENYLKVYPDDKDILYNYAEVEANNRDYFKAQITVKYLLKMEPDNLKYQLFMAELDGWTGQNFDEAEKYLQNVLMKEPDNLRALVAMSFINMQQNDFSLAENYMNKIKTINPYSAQLKSLQSALTLNQFRYKQEKNYAILSEAEKLYSSNKCKEALSKYEEFLRNSPPNPLIEKEFADVNVCAGNYQKAVDIYTDLLKNNYDFNIDYTRATTYYAMGDSIEALSSFKRLADKQPDNFYVSLYLGDSYVRMKEYDEARDVYDRMEKQMKLDSLQISMVKQRYKWLPVTGFRGMLSSFPTYTLITPYGSYYSDNLGIKNNIEGLRVDLGLTTFLSIGAEAFRTNLTSDTSNINANTIRFGLTFRLFASTTFGVNFGNTYYLNSINRPITDIFFRSEETNHYSIYGNYSRMDASQIIYAPYLISTRLSANLFRAGGYYQTQSGIKFSADYSNFGFQDGNDGYALSLRLGKYFSKDFILGYEFYNSGFRTQTTHYFSPLTYSSNNVWADWEIYHKSNSTVTIGGLIGFVENSNYILRQAYLNASILVINRLTIQGRISGGSSFQNVVGYSSFAASITAYWAL